MIYLATSNSPAIREAVASGLIGRLCTPQGGSPPTVGEWGADSGCFTLGDRFSLEKYLAWLRRLAPYASRCHFAPAPDVVADHAATLARSLPVLPTIRALGYPAALVGQDGATPETMPWGEFDVLFLGGSTEWKLGPEARALCSEARRRGIPIHVGRVNSRKRYLYSRDTLAATSADGTYLSFGPTVNLPQVISWGQEGRPIDGFTDLDQEARA